MQAMNFVRRGRGRPLLLLHGLGGSWRSWSPVLDDLATVREVIAVDLPGFGASAPLSGPTTISTLADAVADFVVANSLRAVDAVGSSMGARLVLELARRGSMGSVVALDPGGFWQGWERHAFYGSIAASIRLIRALQSKVPFIATHASTRALLFAQLSAHPSRLPPELVLDEMRSFAASPVFDELLHDLAFGPEQQGAPAGSISRPVVIGWGRQDRVCFPHEANSALAHFPDAQLRWFDDSGHFPHWDHPRAAVGMILDATAPPRDLWRRHKFAAEHLLN
jgi:pimeloyl-ACP methyl ester carboxylesterase